MPTITTHPPPRTIIEAKPHANKMIAVIVQAKKAVGIKPTLRGLKNLLPVDFSGRQSGTCPKDQWRKTRTPTFSLSSISLMQWNCPVGCRDIPICGCPGLVPTWPQRHRPTIRKPPTPPSEKPDDHVGWALCPPLQRIRRREQSSKQNRTRTK